MGKSGFADHELDDGESDIDDGESEGPAGPRSRRVQSRVTSTMYKDLRIASAQTDCTLDELARDGFRYVLYGVEPRRKAILAKR